MDKNAIRKYAVWARRELLERVAQRAACYGITDQSIVDVNVNGRNGNGFTAAEKKQRQDLIDRIQVKGYEEVMEEVAYSWFIRFIAIRFMEVNGYLPGHIRVFTDEKNHFQPQILTEALHLEMDGLAMEKVHTLKAAKKEEELYKHLLIVLCNALGKELPAMFQKLEDYMELLFPDAILQKGSVIEQMIRLIPEEDWKEQVQIIGWLYQYYNSVKKEQVFEALKKNVKITKENIPAATQLFTPDWIVKYMVENSLGRMWVEGHPEIESKEHWKYYLEEGQQEPLVEKELDRIHAEYAKLTPEEIKVMDPCMGSGHILVYAFEVLMQMYKSAGYTQEDAARLIVEKNIYGLDIDDRAGQLAYFAVMMMARKYNSGILNKGMTPNVMAIRDSSNMNESTISFVANGNIIIENDLMTIKTVFADAKEYGSILQVPEVNFEAIYVAVKKCQDRECDQSDVIEKKKAICDILPLVKQAQWMSQKYEVCITNPPYMGKKSLNGKISAYLDEYFSRGKSELYSAFILKCLDMTAQKGFVSMVTMHTWMFISSFEELRKQILRQNTLCTMVHTGAATFEELNSFNVLATTFCIRKQMIANYNSKYVRLAEYYNTEEKISNFHNAENMYYLNAKELECVPGNPFVYWISKQARDNFRIGTPLRSLAEPKQGMATADNKRFVRYWFEVPREQICFGCADHEEALHSNKKWFPYNKGGNFRKWYGMNEYVVNWEKDGLELRKFKAAVLRNPGFYFKDGITWSLFGFENFGVRYKDTGFLFDVSGSSMFPKADDMLYILAFLASKVAFMYLSVLAPTVNFQVGNIGDLPLIIAPSIKAEIESLARECIDISREDWDENEYSWDFKENPILKFHTTGTLQEAYEKYAEYAEERYEKLRGLEEKINSLFIGVYRLNHEMTAEVIDRDIAVKRSDRKEDMIAFISFAVGCILGRFQCEDFTCNPEGIITISDEEYFTNDLLKEFIRFVREVFGRESLEDNLKFIAESLGGKGTCLEVLKNYFMNSFWPDHLKMYSNTPIYWLFDSGKKNGFKCLIPMHGYQPDTIARIRTDYVHELQAHYRTAIEEMEGRIGSAAQREKGKLTKKLQSLRDRAEELKGYEEKLHHLADQMISIDLDDGVKVNYAKFQDVLAKMK